MSKHRRKKKKRSKLIYFFNFLMVLIVAVVAVGAIYMNRGIDIDEPALSNGDQQQQNTGKALTVSGKRKANNYNILVFGSDVVGTNTDTIMVVNLDAANKKLNILHIPRDTIVMVNGHERKMNSVYGNKKTEGLIDTIEDMFGLKIDKYVRVSTKGFREIVDAIGGVTIDVPQDMKYKDPYQDLEINLKKGLQVLDGRQSEGFVRFRSGYADADLGRIKAQKQWMSAFMDELLQPKNLTKVPELVGIVFNNIETDLTNDELLYLALQGASIGLGDATFFTIPGEEKGANFGAYKEETVTMVNQHFNVYTEDVPASKFNIQEFKRKYENSVTDHEGTTASEYEGKDNDSGQDNQE